MELDNDFLMSLQKNLVILSFPRDLSFFIDFKPFSSSISLIILSYSRACSLVSVGRLMFSKNKKIVSLNVFRFSLNRFL